MELAFGVLVLVVIAALAFDFINGFHDTANAIATVVSTGVLPMRTAILMAAALNLVGAFMGTAVAKTIGTDVLQPETITQVVVLAALLSAIFWDLWTWYYGIPSSSSHALIGGILGAGIANQGFAAAKGAGILKIVKSLILSPLVGFALGFLMMLLILWLCRRGRPMRLTRAFKRLQLVSSSFMAFSHGSNDAQKTMGIITMALVAYGAVHLEGGEFHVPFWVVVACALAMGFGTAAGGLRIIKTMGTKIIDLKPAHGFAAETSAAGTIMGASALGLPVSTTHVISGSIMGVGAVERLSSVRWGVTAKIMWAWVLTIPITAVVAALAYGVLQFVLGR